VEVPRLLASHSENSSSKRDANNKSSGATTRDFDLARSFFDSSLATARQKMTSWSLIKEMKRLPYTPDRLIKYNERKFEAVLMLIWLYHFEAWYKEAASPLCRGWVLQVTNWNSSESTAKKAGRNSIP
jgi:hypothetical protein